MTYRYIMLEAGLSERFGGVDKSSLVIGGNGETLLARANAQFPGLYRLSRSILPNSRCTCDTFMLSAPMWGDYVTILLGDVFYSDAVAAQIRDCHETVAFFSDTQDIFAVCFARFIGMTVLLPAAQAVVNNGYLNNNGRLWEMYRRMCSIADNAPLPPENRIFLRMVNDETQDFDSPDEYDAWRNGISKNKLKKVIP